LVIIWTTQSDKYILNQGLYRLLKTYKLEHQIKITSKVVTSKDHLVLALGDWCKQKLADLKIVPKNRTINSLRNKIHEHEGTKYLISYDPDVEQYKYDHFVDLKWDLKLARRYEQTNSLAPVTGNYSEIVELKTFYEEAIAQFDKTGKKPQVSVSELPESLIIF